MSASRPNKLSARAVRNVRQAWADGASLSEIGAEHGVSSPAVRHHVKGLERGAKPRPHRLRSFDYERAAALVRQGFDLAEVAKRFGVTKPAISYALKKVHGKGITR